MKMLRDEKDRTDSSRASKTANRLHNNKGNKGSADKKDRVKKVNRDSKVRANKARANNRTVNSRMANNKAVNKVGDRKTVANRSAIVIARVLILRDKSAAIVGATIVNFPPKYVKGCVELELSRQLQAQNGRTNLRLRDEGTPPDKYRKAVEEYYRKLSGARNSKQ